VDTNAASERLLKLRIDAKVPPAADEESSGYRLHRRFDRMGRLIGDDKMRRLLGAHVMVFGQGGVGSWAAEALARSGVGRLTIVDFDVVCVTNANRQLHAMRGTTGRPKVEVMAERLRQIHPGCTVTAIAEFYNRDSSAKLLSAKPDLVIDAIDNVSAKAHLIASCWQSNTPLIVSGGASGRLDPTQIRESDMSEVRDDAFVAATRKVLRRRFALPSAGTPWGIRCIHSQEPISEPIELHYDLGMGFQCVCPNGDNSLHSCDSRNVIYGTAGFVTGAFGLACAAAAVRLLIGPPQARGVNPALRELGPEELDVEESAESSL
jgi:tRNA A37 threonylcarbamoyladenosine dehydratase